MRKPWDISSGDIDRWAERVGAASVLPSLVRRLLSATLPLRSLEMRAAAGAHLEGWDGLVVAGERGPFCPAGVSVWEFSVSPNVATQLDDSFARRTEAPRSPVVPSRTTYVAVTARRFSAKAEWAEAKRTASVWADVRVCDADDLAAWLTHAPAVARWFAAELGRAPAEAIDIETFLAAWTGRTSPPLPFDLALAGPDRNAAARAVRAWLADSRPTPLLVRGDTREEAVVFVAAVLAAAPPLERERWLSRALVVDTRDAFRWATIPHEGEPLILLPTLADVDMGRATGRAHVVLPRGSDDDGRMNVVLSPIPPAQIADALTRAGLGVPQAHQLAEESRGKLTALQRLCGYVERPAWAARCPRGALFAMLLLGAWEPANEADRGVVRRLGADPRELATTCASLSRGPDAPISGERTRGGKSVWSWTDADQVWRALARELTDEELRRFKDVALDTLGQTDPAYDVPKTARSFAVLAGADRSAALREGLAESLVRLGARRARLAAEIVRQLLPPSWKPWASLSDLLPMLAEASPDAFLDALDGSLDRGDEGVAHLFDEEGDFTSPHTGLLWALETLGWSPDLMPRVADALARLAAHDPGGRDANRPANSLSDLLHYAMPQTAAPLEERLRVLGTLLQRHPDVGWRLAVGMLGRLHMDMMTPARRPKHLPWRLPPEHTAATPAEAQEELSGVVAMLIRHAGADAARWSALIEPAQHLPDHLEAAVLDALDAVRERLSDPEGAIWTALRSVLHVKCRSDRDAASDGLAHLERLYKVFTPADFVVRTAWLFSPRPALPERVSGGFRAMEAQIEMRRMEVAQELWRGPDPWGTLAALVRAVASPARLGEALGKISFADELIPRLLTGARDDVYAPLTSAFAATLLGAKGYPWLADILRGLLAWDRLDDAAGIVIALDSTKQLWDTLDAIGDPLRLAYWRGVTHIHADGPDQWERAIRNLLARGREAAAMEAASRADESVAPTTVLQVLERLLTARPSDDMDRIAREGMVDVHLERLFEALDRDPTIDVDRAARLELSFLPHLKDSSRPIRHLFAAMEQSPDFFVDLVNKSYRRHGEDASVAGEDLDHRRRQAERAHEILSAWTGHPGRGLADDDDRERRLHAWASEALARTSADGRSVAGTIEVATVLARAPAASDGLWPCRAARELLESGTYKLLGHHLQLAERNLRGMQARGAAARHELNVSANLQAAADELRGAWPRTAEMLAELASTYEAEGDA